MKKKKLFILPIAVLSLIACTGNGITETTKASTNTSYSDAVSNDSTVSEPVIDVDSSTTVEHESDASDSSIDYTDGWANDVKGYMTKYLGGTVVPYYELANNSSHQYGHWDVTSDDYGILTVEGNIDWKDGTADAITKLFTDAGWTVDGSSSSSVAVKAYDSTKKVTATYEKDSIGCIVLYCTYDEDYDYDSYSSGSWDKETLSEMNSEFGIDVPYVYLGTANPYAKVDSFLVTQNISISGGKWNDNVISDATETLMKKEYKVEADPKGKTLTATGKSSNGNGTFTIKISNQSAGVSKILMEVTFQETFDGSSFSEWPSAIKSDFDKYLHKHSIPVTYLGTNDPKSGYSSEQKKLMIVGNTWDDSILTDAIDKWGLEGWGCEDDESSREGDPYVTFQKEITEDGCLITATIKKNYSGYPEIDISIKEGLAIPDDCKDWTDNTQELMQDNLGYVLPYFYMNTNAETTTWDKETSTLYVNGGTWVDKIGDYAYKALDGDEKLTWHLDKDENTYTVTATATDKVGNRYEVTVKKAPVLNTAIMTVKYVQIYTAKSGEWEGEALDCFNNHLDGNVLPYVYLRSDSPSAYYDSDLDSITITGGTWDDGMIDAAKDAYTEDLGWTDIKWGSGTYTSYFQATKTFSQGYEATVRIYNDADTNIAYLYVTKKQVYLDDNQPSSWQSATTTSMTDNLGINIPYIYLGANKEAVKYEALSDTTFSFNGLLTITGGSWDDRIINAAKTTLTGDSWTVSETNNDYGKSIMAYKSVNSLTYFLTIEHDDENIPVLKCWKNTATTYNTDGTFDSDDVVDPFQENTDQTTYMLPYIDLGSNVAASWDISNDCQKIQGDKTLSQVQVLAYYNKLLTDTETVSDESYSWTNLHITSGNEGLIVTGTRKLSNGGKITITLKNGYKYNSDTNTATYVGTIYITYKEAFVDYDGATAWNADITAAMKKYLDGYVVPYFYMGDTEDVDISYSDDDSYKYMYFESYDWDEQIFANMIKAVTEDGGWSYMYDYASMEDGDYNCLWASKTLDNGKHVTLKLYNDDGSAMLYIYYR